MKSFAISLSLVGAIALFSCHKNNSSPSTGNTPPPVNPTGTMKISLAMPVDTFITNCELIIREPGGKILLDTLAPQRTIIDASLSTNASLVDVTIIEQSKFQQNPITYAAITYKAVNPTSWKVARSSSGTTLNLGVTASTVRQEIYIEHPLSTSDEQLSASFSSFESFSLSGTGDTLDLQYNQVPGSYFALLFPSQGVYFMHIPNGLHDTIDCLTAPRDTAVVQYYNSSPGYSFWANFITGVSDTVNPNKYTLLYVTYNTGSYPSQHIMYPRATKFQKYFVYASFVNRVTGESYTVYTYGPSISPTITYPSNGYYTLGATQPDNFSVTFNTGKPTYYFTNINNSTITYQIYSSPDSTNLNPMELLTAQKSKLLQGQDLSSMKFSSFNYENVPGYGYSDYLGWLCNPAVHDAKPVSGSVTYTKSF